MVNAVRKSFTHKLLDRLLRLCGVAWHLTGALLPPNGEPRLGNRVNINVSAFLGTRIALKVSSEPTI